MSPTLYMVPASPPVRAVLMTARAIGLNLTLKTIDFSKGEHKTPEYLKLNPLHTVPTLVDDDGFTIWDSHAINPYLITKYAKNDDLYPNDLRKRARVNQMMHFDCGVAFPVGFGITSGFFFGNKTRIYQSEKDKVKEVYQLLKVFLEGREWIAGDSLSIADYHLFAGASTLNVILPFDRTEFPKLAEWMSQMDSLPEAEENRKGLSFFQAIWQRKNVE